MFDPWNIIFCFVEAAFSGSNKVNTCKYKKKKTVFEAVASIEKQCKTLLLNTIMTFFLMDVYLSSYQNRLDISGKIYF